MADLTFSAEQQALRSAFADLFAKHASIERVRSAEPLGFDQGLWDALVATGAPVLGVPESAGGASASAVDLAVVAQELGRRIAPAPLVEAIAATGALAAAGGQEDLIAEIAAGGVLPTLALAPPRGAVVRLAPAGAVADALVTLSEGRLLLDRRGGARPHAEAVPNLASAPLADWVIGDDAIVLAEGEQAQRVYSDAVSTWQLLSAAALTGLGQTALGIGVDYVKQRHAFGVRSAGSRRFSTGWPTPATAIEGGRLLV